MTADPSSTPSSRRQLAHHCLRSCIRLIVTVIAGTGFYLLMVLQLGWLATNPGYVQATRGTEIFVWSNGLHTDFLVPVRTPIMDWGAYAPYSTNGRPEPHLEYVVIGWGDHDFYIETPTDAEFSLAITLKAIFLPSQAVMHISYYTFAPQPGPRCVRLVLNDAEYRQFVDCLRSGFELDARSAPIEIPGANYGRTDVFYRGTGSYHLLYTCNNWANQALQTTGVTTPIWSPFEYAIFDHVKNR